MRKFDFVIIGSGSAGVSAAITADALGASTLMVEKGLLGGACINVGCIPTKNLLRAGEVVHLARERNLHGIKGNQYVSLSFAAAIKDAEEVVELVRRDKFEEPLERLQHFMMMRGVAEFVSDNEIKVDHRLIRGDKFLIATGSSSLIPPIEGLAETGYLTNEGILNLPEPPESLVVLGAGPLGLEFAQMFAHFGTKVTVIQRGTQILSGVEPEVADQARLFLAEDGVQICTGESASKVSRQGMLKEIVTSANGEERRHLADEILLAVGRRANTAGLGLAAAGVELDRRGAVVIDDELRTNVPGIFAAGDARGEPMLENAAAKEGAIAAQNALAGARLQMDYDAVPNCTFTHPEIAQVGLTESEAARRHHEVEARVLDFAFVPKAQVMREPRGLIKMVAERSTRRILGCSIVAEHAGDLIHEAVVAVKQKLTVDDLSDMVHVYPTLSEAVGLAAQLFARDLEVARKAAMPEEKAA